MGRVLLPGPFLPCIASAARTVLSAGSHEQKKRHLSAIADGSAIVTMGMPDAGTGPGASNVALEAVPQGDGFMVNGVLDFVPYAHVADRILFAAGTGERKNPEEGVTLFLADTGADGVRVEPLTAITGDKPCRVTFNNAPVPVENIIGSPNGGWPVMEEALNESAVAECGWMVGGAKWVLETAVEYAKQRVQFGVPIGSFQAIQHKCADMLTLLEGASFMTYHAAWAISEDEPEKESSASEAKVWCSDMFNRVADEGIQIMGGIGFTLEHDMQLYYRRARASDAAFGDAHHHREKLARMFGL